MARFVARRLGLLLLALVVSSFVVFISLDLAPGDPLSTLTGGRTLPPSALATLRAQYHLNDPMLVRYWHYVTGVVLHFNLGTSIQYREPVTTLISQRIGVTAELVVYAGLLIIVFGVGFGLLAGLRRGVLDSTDRDRQHRAGGRPVVRGRDRPHLGVRGEPRLVPGAWQRIRVRRHHPAPDTAGDRPGRIGGGDRRAGDARDRARRARPGARADGGEPRDPLAGWSSGATCCETPRSPSPPCWESPSRHCSRSRRVVEQAFNLNGIGSALVQAALNKDFGVVQGISLLLVGAFVIANALVDLLYAVLDPRVAIGARAS